MRKDLSSSQDGWEKRVLSQSFFQVLCFLGWAFKNSVLLQWCFEVAQSQEDGTTPLGPLQSALTKGKKCKIDHGRIHQWSPRLLFLAVLLQWTDSLGNLGLFFWEQKIRQVYNGATTKLKAIGTSPFKHTPSPFGPNLARSPAYTRKMQLRAFTSPDNTMVAVQRAAESLPKALREMHVNKSSVKRFGLKSAAKFHGWSEIKSRFLHMRTQQACNISPVLPQVLSPVW